PRPEEVRGGSSANPAAHTWERGRRANSGSRLPDRGGAARRAVGARAHRRLRILLDPVRGCNRVDRALGAVEALQAVWPRLRALGASLVALSPQVAQYGRVVRRR